MNQADDLSAAVEPVVAAFEKLGIRYREGDSVASSFTVLRGQPWISICFAS